MHAATGGVSYRCTIDIALAVVFIICAPFHPMFFNLFGPKSLSAKNNDLPSIL